MYDSKWHIDVLEPTDCREVFSGFKEAFTLDELKALSLKYPGCLARASKYARFRYTVRDGHVVFDQPDLAHFYLPEQTPEWDRMAEAWHSLSSYTAA